MRFQTPQFIDIEDKIFGPLTFKQFIYIAGAAGICVLLWFFLPRFLAILLGAPVAALGAALAFYKVNDRPFISVVESFFNYTTGAKLYIWKKEEKKPTPKTAAERSAPATAMYVPKLSQSKLKDLTWQLDIKENENPVTRDNNRNAI